MRYLILNMPTYSKNVGVANHAVTRYRQRVNDGKKGLTHKQIERKIKDALSDVNPSSLPELNGGGYAAPVRFNTNRGHTRNYYCILKPSYNKDEWSVVSLLTEDMLDGDIRNLI